MLRRGLSFALAVFLWLACAFELVMVGVRAIQGTLAEARFVGPLLAEPGPERLAPVLVLLVFAWVVVQVMVHAIRISREDSATQRFKAGSSAVLAKLPESTRAGRRARLLGKHAASPEVLTESLPAAASLDATALDNGYGVLKAYIWTLPVLGFIGTAWGMAHAISGFSEALGAATSGNGIQVLTDRLAQFVIPGLAGAFGITMLALTASIISHFWVTALQAWDQNVLYELDRETVARVAELAPASEARSWQGPFMNELSMLVEQMRSLTSKLDLSEAAERLQQAAMAHVAAAQEIRGAALQLQESISAPYHITITREQVQ